MTERLDYQKQAPALFKKLLDYSMAAHAGAIEEPIQDLIAIRASQLNGCGFCVDMHVKQATLHGERPLRLHHLTVWRESPLFSPRERAALAWTEVLTQLPPQGVPDELYEAGAGPAVRAGCAGPHPCGDGHQRLEPHQHRLPQRAGLARQGLGLGQGRP